jgi:hypothetical protein
MRRGGSGEGGGERGSEGREGFLQGSFRGNTPARGFDWDVQARLGVFQKKNEGVCRIPRGSARGWDLARGETHYIVSGGPMMVICHSKTLESSTRPAEKPSMGLRLSSGRAARRGGRRGDGRKARREAGVGRGVGGVGGRLTGTRAREARGGARDRGSGNAARGSRGRNRANARGSEGAPLSCFLRRSTAWSDMTHATWGDARGDRDVRASARTPPEGVRRAGPVRASGVRVSSPRSEGSRGRAGRASKAARVRSTTDARRPGRGRALSTADGENRHRGA